MIQPVQYRHKAINISNNFSQYFDSQISRDNKLRSASVYRQKPDNYQSNTIMRPNSANISYERVNPQSFRQARVLQSQDTLRQSQIVASDLQQLKQYRKRQTAYEKIQISARNRTISSLDSRAQRAEQFRRKAEDTVQQSKKQLAFVKTQLNELQANYNNNLDSHVAKLDKKLSRLAEIFQQLQSQPVFHPSKTNTELGREIQKLAHYKQEYQTLRRRVDVLEAGQSESDQSHVVSKNKYESLVQQYQALQSQYSIVQQENLILQSQVNAMKSSQGDRQRNDFQLGEDNMQLYKHNLYLSKKLQEYELRLQKNQNESERKREERELQFAMEIQQLKNKNQEDMNQLCKQFLDNQTTEKNNE